MNITLETVVNTETGKTLAETVERMKANGLVRLFVKGDENGSLAQDYRGFERALRHHEMPSNGEALAAYYVTAVNALDDEYYADDTSMTAGQYKARKAAITRLVFRRN